MNLTSNNIQTLITQKASELGFFKTGFAKYEVLDEASQKLRLWLDNGYAADMGWIERGFEKRKDIRNILSEAKSVISLAYNYFTPFEHNDNNPKISRYAWGKDYHKVLKPKLKEISRIISESGFKSAAYVDDGPVMDKVWAQKSGIGWMGKHTNIINTEYGSWFFICTIITNIEFEAYNKPIEDLCGDCSLCISACPTGAIIEEYIVDSNRCISYQTIENRGEIPAELNLDGWIFGCDVCQDVCPYNSPKYNHVTEDKNFYPSTILSGSEGYLASSEMLNSLTEEEFTQIFSDSPVRRTKYKGWRRNLGKI